MNTGKCDCADLFQPLLSYLKPPAGQPTHAEVVGSRADNEAHVALN